MKALRTLIVIVLLIQAGCEEKTDFGLESNGGAKLVVEGVVSNLRMRHSIKISSTHLYQNEQALAISGAIVRISNGVDFINLRENPGVPGEYLTPVMRFISDQAYTLQVRYNGQIYLASDVAVPIEPMEPLIYATTEFPGMYTLVFEQTGVEPNYIHYDIDWSNTPVCGSQNLPCSGEIFYYDLKSIDVHEIYKPSKEPYYFPSGTVIIRTKYSVSEQYKDFLRSVLSETEWRGGVFDTERANPATNLSNGAVGFFAVTTALSDTLIIK